MAKNTYIRLTVIISLVFLTTCVYAQEQQWLQYHSAREVRLIGFSSGLSNLEVTTEKPAGVELPQFKSDEPIFAKWSTPMVEKGCLWIALDKTHKQGLYDNLYIDSNGDGNLSDETAVMAYRSTQSSTYFGPVKVIFQIEDGPVTYHLNFQFYGSDDNKRLYASSGGWYEGDITVNDVKKHCVLFDGNANGTFNDKSLNAWESDRIRIGESSSQDASFVGNYIMIDDKLYEPQIARDGACITLAEAKDVKYGLVRLPESVTQLSAGGENGSFIVKPENETASLPVGKYRITNWIVERKDDKGTQWKLQAAWSGGKGDFEITKAKEATLDIGEPIQSSLTSSLREGIHYFSQSLNGRDGERITLTRNGAQPQAPKLNIKSKDGTYDRTYSFSYG